MMFKLAGNRKLSLFFSSVPTPVVALIVQILAFVVLLVLSKSLSLLQTLTLFELAVLQGILASVISYLFKMPIWWTFIHFLFTPALVAALALALSPLWFLGAFLLTVLYFGKIYVTRVPFYLSSSKAIKKLAGLLPKNTNFSFVDLGCAHGGLLKELCSLRPNGKYSGIEAALLPFFIGKIKNFLNKSASNIELQRGDFWKYDLSAYDVVYAYLSPVSMQALWGKACCEMKSGALLISNSFEIPGVMPERSIKLNGYTESALYVWRMDKKQNNCVDLWSKKKQN